ncbi:terminase TerL endonuclease subunit [Mycolicibacterium sp. J2]|uniref:terminase TerL endonuclease subunit n=1 Tax=Mycolicibacterium sp. J2 TaxID=2993511 RepID=UPI00224A8F03|nr:terminase TerL endonuclease subunit [Mycolicibacterium sp. J2]MCX2716081.1 terminase large subunit [Mycolicibacterium sp. J2]
MRNINHPSSKGTFLVPTPRIQPIHPRIEAKAVSHDGDERLAAHMANCVAKRTPAGDLVSKDKKNSPRKIDAAVAAIAAFDSAAAVANTTENDGVWFF